MATNYLKLGAEILQSQMETFAGVTVTYSRPGKFSFEIVAVPGRNPVDVVDNDGLVLRGQIQDFTVNAKTLQTLMTSDPKYPVRNDEIVMRLATGLVVYVVNGETISSSHYEPSDSYGIAWRIHTKSDRHA